MVFGFFSRKPQLQEDGANADSNPSASNTGSVPPQSPSPPPEYEVTEPHVVPTDIASLYKLVKSMPPKVLHDYTIARLRSEDDSHFGSVLSFFSELKPPERLHCVRCHQNYFEVDNTDRSCQIEHDDESAVVERAGGEYETLYGCCDRTVEGKGDMGPPAGWCFEGSHTSDPVRARFRADSTPRDPKLTACTRRCGPVSGIGITRKRRRVQLDSEGTDDEGEEDSGVEEMTGTKNKPKPASPKKRAPKKSKLTPDELEHTEALTTPQAATSATESPAPKPRKRAPKKSIAKIDEDDENMDTSPAEVPAPKSRKKPAKKGAATADGMDEMAEDAPADSPALKPRRRAPRKSTVTANEEEGMDAGLAESPASKPRKRPTKKSAATVDEEEPAGASTAEKPKSRARPKKADDMDVDIERSPKPKPTRTPVKRSLKAKAEEELEEIADAESGPSPKPSVKSAMKGKPAAKPRSTANRAKSLKEVVATSIEGEDA